MLKASFVFCFLFCCYFVFSQTPFEGKISYKLTTENENRWDTVEVLYGKQKIKGVLKNAGLEFSNNEGVLIDFLKGVIYTINDPAKTYRADSLKNNPENGFFIRSQKSGVKKNILGQSCSAFSFIDTSKRSYLNVDMDFLLWYADSLYFPVSEEYRNTNDIRMFTNGKNIGMGMTMNIDLPGKKTLLDLQPIDVMAMSLADSLFDLPKGYTLKETNLQEVENYELKLSEIKSEESPPPPPPPPVPAKKKKKGKS